MRIVRTFRHIKCLHQSKWTKELRFAFLFSNESPVDNRGNTMFCVLNPTIWSGTWLNIHFSRKYAKSCWEVETKKRVFLLSNASYFFFTSSFCCLLLHPGFKSSHLYCPYSYDQPDPNIVVCRMVIWRLTSDCTYLNSPDWKQFLSTYQSPV